MKFRVRLAAGAAALTAMLCAAQASQAAIIDWTLSNGTFDDGGTFSGTFAFDTTADAITDWNIVTTDGSYHPGIDFLTFNSASDNGDGPSFFSAFIIFTSGFGLHNMPLGTPGTVTSLTGVEGFSALGFIEGVHTVTGGQAVGVLAIPEPASWAMMVVGAGLAGSVLRRSRRAVAAV